MKKIAAMAARGPKIMGRNGMLSWLHSKTLLSPSSARLDGLVCFPLVQRSGNSWPVAEDLRMDEEQERFNNENDNPKSHQGQRHLSDL